MGKVFQLILRFGPLIAALALGVKAVYPEAGQVADSIVSVLGAFGVTADPAVLAEIGNATLGITALVGVARKLYALVKTYFEQTIA